MGLLLAATFGLSFASCASPTQVPLVVELSWNLSPEHEQGALTVLGAQLLERGVAICREPTRCKQDRACAIAEAREGGHRVVLFATLAKSRETVADLEAIHLATEEPLGQLTYPLRPGGGPPELESLAKLIREANIAAEAAPLAEVAQPPLPEGPGTAAGQAVKTPSPMPPPLDPGVRRQAGGIHPWWPLGAGLGLAVGGAVSYALALGELRTLEEGRPLASEQEVRQTASRGRTFEAVGLGALALGAVGVTTGVVLAVRGPGGAALQVAPTHDGLALSLSGSLP
jgi:hypothetical protein